MERIFDVSKYPVLFPSLHQHEWSSRDVGSKTLISRSKERALSLGTYTIGVYGAREQLNTKFQYQFAYCLGSKTTRICRRKHKTLSLKVVVIWDYHYGIVLQFPLSNPINKRRSVYSHKLDEDVQNNHELQAWWKELRGEGHRDKKSEPWWPKMQNREEFMETCTIIIWVASALHAAVNFGQYPIAVYLPNRPTISRQFTPKENTQEFEELEKNPDKLFLKTITTQR
ncbi:unnamed protein product [Arabis nemorensis]|uniref:Lipoxygenase domain-containing protein n=1 Tax=Arabis nemorensis TaxID=586526 RepID=A0A565CNU4_9BRAS|nr:unnamed protein product [Arabis nemorensis]